MGLPLFVAPVESDIPSRIGDKSGAARQARSSIRRARREVNSRPFRRRTALLRDNFPTPGPEPIPRPRYPWIESGHPPPPEAYVAPPPRTTPPSDADRPVPESSETRQIREMREMRDALIEARSRGADPSDARLISLFGERWVLENIQPHRRPNAGSPPPASGDEPRSFWEEVARSNDDGPGAYDFIAERRRLPRATRIARSSMPVPPVAARFDRSPEHSTEAGTSYRGPRPPRGQSAPRGGLRRRPAGYLAELAATDGLGDRNRSISPDEDGVWDTLLTTLTPDPQPPSAGSSFASATASASASALQSQSAMASSRTSLTGPDAPEESLEQPCESGVDGSDSEGQEDLHMGNGWPDHWSMNYPSRHRRFVTDLNADDPSRISYLRADSYRRADAAHRRAERFYSTSTSDRFHSSGTPDEAEMRARRRYELARHYRIATRDPTPLPELLDHIVRDSSEESRGAGGQGDADADLAPTSQSHSANDNALHGMQMIVRNLARREDIPDEWWAGAGLSRTLPEES